MPLAQLDTSAEIEKLIARTKAVSLPQGLQDKLEQLFTQLQINAKAEESFWNRFQEASRYIDWVTSLPWNKSSEDILDLSYAREKLDSEHYGLDSVKERLLEYVSVLALQKHRTPDQKLRAPVLLFQGLVGTGKTTMAKSIAQMMGRQLIRIPFGGLGDPLYLRGQSRQHPEAEPGQIIKGLRACQTNNPVILLDEIDRVADEALNTIMGVLVELLDPEQNGRFEDHYLEYPFDLSNVLFVATCNNTSRIATAVMDRLELIQMPSYTDEEKVGIGKLYLFPRALKDAGLSKEEVIIGEDLWPIIVRPLGFDSGVRTLKRNIEGMCRKAAKEILSGKVTRLVLTSENIKTYLPQW